MSTPGSEPNKVFPLGGVVKQRRHELSMNQAELAERAGISQSFLSQIERGQIELPRGRDERRKLAEALRMGHLELLMAAGIVDHGDLPSAAGPYVIASPTQVKLDQLPPESRRAVEKFIDEIWRANAANAANASKAAKPPARSTRDRARRRLTLRRASAPI
ncbi:MAG: hypothetical protein AVDCRST_MAG59-4652 [uncultured Thermomicrobiales bacterium]|uniref:HTH cro/C1-type domain-containing protein n=1 Tax=uncultured Thermomicrobiales bacterium TaxID=1645740 RepID=A0A6J4VIB6_9BACT|nr:MAG: hypothetical protein AVDCRST_MAG59-4652 [uncultured Thermomicrobiales bacterium]